MAVTKVLRLARVALNSRDPGALARFYVEALGFTRVAAMGGSIALALGPSSRLDLVAVGAGARPYPGDVPGWSPLFQHCALVAPDMDAAMTRLKAAQGWRAISTAGPERLPASSGGVAAFKFRDPEGHPLEFLSFARGAEPPAWRDLDGSTGPVGIDHSAISVAELARSEAFYAALGFAVTARSHNVGPEQARLDDAPGADVDVRALTPARAPPHLELLHYRGAFVRDATLQMDDVAATRLVFAVEGARERETLRDPDGHFIDLESA